jgi:hypothetical protein
MRRRLAFLIPALLLALAPLSQVSAQDPDPAAEERARAYFEKGKVAFQLQHFEEAIEWFEKAYEEVQFPAFLLNIAQCYKQLHRCDKAIFLYKQYLRQEAVVDREGTQRLIDECEKELAEKPPPDPTTQPATEPTTAPSPAASPLSYLSLGARASFGAGSAGSRATGGKNFTGPGVALFAAAMLPVGAKFKLGVEAAAEGTATGVVAARNGDDQLTGELAGGNDLRGALTALFAVASSPKLELFGGAGPLLGVAGAGAVAVRLSGGGVFDLSLPARARLLALLSYDRGGVNGDITRALGCVQGCAYQELSLSLGVRLALR